MPHIFRNWRKCLDREKRSVEGAPEIEAPFTIPADHDLSGVELRITGTDGVRVLVLDDRGIPVAGAEVYGDAGPPRNARATTGPDGRALLRFADPSVRVGVLIDESGGRYFLPLERQVATADSRDLTFVLVEAGTVSGEVVTADGKSVAHAEIEIVADGKHASSIYADEAGRFTALFPLPGPIDLVLVLRVSAEVINPNQAAPPTLLEGRLDRGRHHPPYFLPFNDFSA